MSDTMNEAALEVLSRGLCPICAHRGFVLGPQGGASINIECANTDCRRRFNVVLFAGTVMRAEQIARRGEGGIPWPSEPER